MVRIQIQHQEDLVLQTSAIQPKPVAQDLRRVHHRPVVHLLAQIAQQQLARHVEPVGQCGLQ
jgi:hypothetical protein